MDSTQAMLDAAKAGDKARVQELVDEDPRLVNARTSWGESAILLAIYYGRQDVRDLLLARGTELNIFEAAAAGQRERVAVLLGKDPALANTHAFDGFTPLGLAAFFGQREIVELLLRHGADVNAVSRNATGYTALTGAVARGDAEIVATLLQHGARADHRYGPGYTPLHEAAVGGKTRIAALLLEHGADPNARAEDGQTPLALAESKRHGGVAALLRKRQAAS